MVDAASIAVPPRQPSLTARARPCPHLSMRSRFGHSLAAVLASSLCAGSVHAQTAVPPPPMAPPPGTQWVWVTLPSLDRNAAVEAFEGIKSRDDDDDEAWRKLCTGPCGMWIPSGTRLRVSGDFRTSGAFALPPRPGGAHLAVDPARNGLRVTGIILLPVGGVIAGVGGIVYLAGSESSRYGGGSGAREARQIGSAFGIFGLAALATGFALFLTNKNTSVDVRDPHAPGPNAQAPRLTLPRVAVAKDLWLSPEGMHF